MRSGDTELGGALEREGSPLVGADAGTLAGLPEKGVAVGTVDPAAALDGADAVVDFTAPAVSTEISRAMPPPSGIAHVDRHDRLRCGGRCRDRRRRYARTAVVKSGNMSMGVILLSVLVEEAARALEAADWDIEVLEMHHRHKVDAPSGTALLLGEAAARGRQIGLAENAVRTRDGHTGPRSEGTVGFATLRGGSVVGDHSVIVAGPGERITLSHHAEDRMIFARGAIRAALWAKGRAPGLYSMHDVLGLARRN